MDEQDDEQDDVELMKKLIQPRVRPRIDIYSSQHRFTSSRGHNVYLSVANDKMGKPSAFKFAIGPGRAELSPHQMYDLFKHLQRYYFREDGE